MRILSTIWSEDCVGPERRRVVHLNGRGFRRRRRPNPEGVSSLVKVPFHAGRAESLDHTWLRTRPSPGGDAERRRQETPRH